MNSGTRIRAGVVGVGHMGCYHVGVYSDLPEVDLVSVVDLDGDRARAVAKQYETQVATDYREIMDQVDVVSVAVPTHLHFQVARDFLEAGVHVLLEKPAAPTLAEAETLFKLARRKGRVLQIGHVERFNGAVQELNKIVRDPILIDCRRMGPFEPRVQADGVVLDLMIHDLDIVLSLVNAPVRSCHATGTRVFSSREDVAIVSLTFETGCIAVLTASRATQEKIRTLSVTQKDAYIVLDYANQDIHIHRQASSEHVLTHEELRYKQGSLIERIFVHKDNPLKLEIRALLHSAANGLGSNASYDGELLSLKLALQILSKLEDQGVAPP